MVTSFSKELSKERYLLMSEKERPWVEFERVGKGWVTIVVGSERIGAAD